MKFPILENEYWWGGAIHHGSRMPFTQASNYTIDLSRCAAGNQSSSFFLSSAGRYLWSDQPFQIRFCDGWIEVISNSAVVKKEGFGNIRHAYLDAMRSHFSPNGTVPEPCFYKTPQYNTWAELTYHHTQKAITNYADAIIENGYAPGVLMIDDTWQADYGVWKFHPERFPDPKAMIDHLHGLGFRVMLWIVPYLSADSAEFRQAEKIPGTLMTNARGEPAIIRWWNGYSAVIDFTTPEGRNWMHGKLSCLMDEYHIDGFKFDGGSVDSFHDNCFAKNANTFNDMTKAYNAFALTYRFEEVKDTWNACGTHHNQRLRDKDHTWDGNGLSCIIPDAIALSLTGHLFLCPDMVGGGEWTYFTGERPLDEELIVRFAQCAALFPMMQFSVAPWRILSPKHAEIVRQAAKLHCDMGEEIYALVTACAKSREPVLRPLCYTYPNAGYETVTDQFLLGNNILVAPVLKKGADKRRVVFPPGKWQRTDGEIISGPCTMELPAPIDTLLWFREVTALKPTLYTGG